MPGADLPGHLDRIATRFAEPKSGDMVRRLCHDGSNRQPTVVVPAIRDRLGASRS